MTLTSLGIVHTPYALFAWSIVIHTLIQIPGFYGVYRTTLNGLQRADYARYIDAAWAILFPILAQLAIVPVFYAWGRANPAIGPAMGAVLGLGVAAYALELKPVPSSMAAAKRICAESGKQFDPAVVAAFMKVVKEFDEVRARHKDELERIHDLDFAPAQK